MPDTDSASAKETAERLHKMVARESLATSNERDILVTTSFGVANWDSDSPLEINAILDRADQALYQTKEGGRNQVFVCSGNKKVSFTI